MIEFQEVSKVYPNGTRALDRVNLIIEKGEFAFIVGPSGAGKSTLLKLILREEKATEGEIFVNGFQLSKIRRWQISRLRRSIGMVFQDFRLIPELSVYDNVAFALRVTNTSLRDIRRRGSLHFKFSWTGGKKPLPSKGTFRRRTATGCLGQGAGK